MCIFQSDSSEFLSINCLVDKSLWISTTKLFFQRQKYRREDADHSVLFLEGFGFVGRLHRTESNNHE